ncbi:MAG: tetratricopeptide repeat protein [Nitrospiria bacterium]
MSLHRAFYMGVFFLMLFPGMLLASPPEERAEALYEEGTALNKRRQFDEAIIRFVQAVKLSPDNHKYHKRLHVTYLATRRIRQGTAFYRNLVDRHPKNAVIHYWLGRFYLSGRFLDDAAKAFKEATLLAPKDDHAFLSLGHVYRRMRKDREALEAYLQADKLAPGVPVIKVGLGNSYFALKEFDKARKEYEEALAEDSSFTEAQFNLGIIYEKNKDYDKAFDQWQGMIETDPNESEAREHLARLYYRGGFYLDAVREYATLSLVKVDSARVFLALGEAQVMLASELNDSKDRDLLKKKAIESFERTLEIDPKNALARRYLERLKTLESEKFSSKRK